MPFASLNHSLREAPVLVYPQFGPEKAFLLETDASAVLSQKQDDEKYHPILVNEKNYPISELETLAIVWAVKKFRAYLLGHPCTILTDHAACLSLLNTPRPSARWAMAIQEFDLEIKHRSGRTNTSADALSRHPVDDAVVCSVTGEVEGPVEETQESAHVDALVLSEDTQRKLSELSRLQQSCPDLNAIFTYLSEKVLPEEDKVAHRLTFESRHFDLLDG